MYMRYYPKQLKPVNRLQQVSFDRGKRHYWGYDRGDYGFYKSEDQQYIRQAKKDRSHKMDYKSYSLQPNTQKILSDRKYYEKKTKMPTERKSILKISNPQDIHLPSIQRTNRQTQTQLIIFCNKVDNQLSSGQRKVQNRGAHRRSVTQPIERYDTVHNFPANTRFSPTFVCSLSNPLPTYIIIPHYYNSLNYVRSEKMAVTRNI